MDLPHPMVKGMGHPPNFSRTVLGRYRELSVSVCAGLSGIKHYHLHGYGTSVYTIPVHCCICSHVSCVCACDIMYCLIGCLFNWILDMHV